MRKQLLLPALASIISWQAFGQQDSVSSNKLDVAVETRSYYYMDDSKANMNRPDDHFGSNNYLTIGYSFDKFSIGLQYEAYAPVAQGYGYWEDSDITMKYLSYQDQQFQFVVGDFQEQFGSGLIFSAYENRVLGINTSLEGFKGSYRYGNKALFKVIYGQPRYYMDRMDSKVRGLDASIAINEYLQIPQHIELQGSYFNRYQTYTGSSIIPENVEAWSARLKIRSEKWRFSAEYVQKSEDILAAMKTHLYKGKAWLLQAGYVDSEWNVSLDFRRLERMYFASSRFSNSSTDYEDWLNYIPSLTRQHIRSLAAMYPYIVRPEGEIGGQLDVNRHFGGAYGMDIRLNGSYFYRLNTQNDILNSEIKKLDFFDTAEKLYHDFNIDIIKRWDDQWESSIFVCNQSFNPILISKASQEWVSNIWAADLTYHVNSQKSWRIEAQHLLMHEHNKNWMALKAEYTNAKWQIHLSDTYNYGNDNTKIHYYEAGVRYVSSDLYAELSAGRHYAQYLYSAGMCRQIPAYTGLNVVLQKKF